MGSKQLLGAPAFHGLPCGVTNPTSDREPLGRGQRPQVLPFAVRHPDGAYGVFVFGFGRTGLFTLFVHAPIMPDGGFRSIPNSLHLGIDPDKYRDTMRAEGDRAMREFTIKSGSRQVIVTEQNGHFAARLYLNNGQTAGHQSWNGKTESGARRWASKILG